MEKNNKKLLACSIASIICGVFGILSFFTLIPIINYIVGLIFGIISLNLAKKVVESNYKKLRLAGKILGIVSVVINTTLIVLILITLIVIGTIYAPYIIKRPAGYGAFHIGFMIISIFIMLAICIPIRKCSDKTFRIVMLVTGLILLGAELYKHMYYAFIIDKIGEDFYSPSQKYEWDLISFQLCSVPMYLSVAIGCMKEGKVRNALCEYCASIGLLGGFMAYVEPSGILHGELFCTLHSSIWHGLLIFMALFIIFTKKGNKSIKDWYKSLPVFAGVVVVATILNVSCFGLRKYGFNMCYISPFRNTPLAVFKDITLLLQKLFGENPDAIFSFGRIIMNTVYVMVVPIGGLILYAISLFIKWIVGLIIKLKKIVDKIEIKRN